MATQENKVESLLRSIKDEQKQRDCLVLLSLMKDITGEEPKLWQGNMLGFGSYKYKYESGREGKWFLTGFCPRKNNLVVYIVDGFKGYRNIMDNLGKHKTGASCLYLNSLNDIDLKLLAELIKKSYTNMQIKYHQSTK